MGKILEQVAADQAQKANTAVLLAFVQQHPEVDNDKNLTLIGDYLEENASGTGLTMDQLQSAYNALALDGQLALEAGFWFSACYRDLGNGQTYTFPMGFHTNRNYYLETTAKWLPVTYHITNGTGKGLDFQFYERTEAARAVNAPLPPQLVEPNLYSNGENIVEGSTKKLARYQMVVNGVVRSTTGVVIRHGDGTGRAYVVPRTDIRDVGGLTSAPALQPSERLIGQPASVASVTSSVQNIVNQWNERVAKNKAAAAKKASGTPFIMGGK